MKKNDGVWFYNNVDKNGPIQSNMTTQCWTWCGWTDKNGYGYFRDDDKNIGVRRPSAHRFSYYLNAGAIPNGLQVLHFCDNPSCVNPAHLWLGTQQDNMDDMVLKGRSSKEPTNVKLSEDDVRKIRKDPRPQKEIAADYDVSKHYIGQVINKTTWKNVK